MSLSNFLIPLTNTPQTFGINLAGVNYTLTVKWNDSDQAGWVLDIYDASQNPIACGLPFITGADMLVGLEYLEFQGALLILTDGDPYAVPTYDDLGVSSNLYFQTAVADNGE